MSVKPTCEECAAELPSNAPQGLCPRCLVSIGLSLSPLDGDGVVPPPPIANRKSHLPPSFGDYELLEEIARGGMGIVYRARQVSLERIVAVKVLLFGKFSSDEFVQRFRAEAQAAAALQHPNIVSIYEVGAHEGQPYFSMEYIEGKNLAVIARDKPLPAKQAAAHLQTIAEAIHYAHQRGVLHRDLKPSNVLIDSKGEPHVTDFGLAKRFGVPPSGGPVAKGTNAGMSSKPPEGGTPNDLTLTGQMLGSPNYMPPEQADRKRGEVSASSDVYALGAILYHLLTGRPPFLAQTLEDALLQVLNSDPVAPRLLNASVPRDLETICLKCLNKEPQRRYASAETLAEDLERWRSGEAIHARPVAFAEKLWRWSKRKPAVAGLAASVFVLLVAVALGATLAAYRIEQARISERDQRRQAEEASTQLQLQRAEDLFAAENNSTAIAYLSRVLRRDPSNRVAAERLYSALTHRSFGMPLILPAKSHYPFTPQYSPDGRRLAATSINGVVTLLEAQSGQTLVNLPRHQDNVVAVDFSSDGRWVVTASLDGTAQVADAETGQAIGAALQHAGRMAMARFSPDGTQVATASHDKTARVWDARTGKPLTPPLLHQEVVHDAGFSPDGSRLVTASKDGYTRIWSTRTGDLLLTTTLHDGDVKGAQFSADGRRILTFADDKTVALWDGLTGEKLAQTPKAADSVTSARFSPEGTRVLVGWLGKSAAMLDAASLRPLGPVFLNGGIVRDAVFSPEGGKVLTVSENSTAVLWDAFTGQALTFPLRHGNWVSGAQFSPDGLRFCTVAADGEVRIWDSIPGAALPVKIPLGSSLHTVRFSPDGTRLLGASAETARLWDSRNGELLARFPHGRTIQSADLSPDGQRILTASADQTAQVWDAGTGKALINPLRHNDDVRVAQWSADGSRVATGSRDGVVQIWDSLTGRPTGISFAHPSAIEHAEFSTDGKQIVTSSGGRLRLWDTVSGKLLHTFSGHAGGMLSVRFSPDGKRIVVGLKLNSALVFETLTGRLAIAPLKHAGWVRHAEFSLDAERIVTASHDGTARIWNARTGQPLTDPLRHRAEVVRARFSREGNRVVTACEDGSVRVWDVVSGLPLTERLTHDGPVTDACFSPDGRRVASAGGTARVWDLPAVPLPVPSWWLDIANALAGQRFNEHAMNEPVLDEEQARLRELFKARGHSSPSPRPQWQLQTSDEFYVRWANWFFADRSTRAIAPFSPITVPEYVQQRIGYDGVPNLREAVRLAPANATALAFLSRRLFGVGIRRNSREFIEGESHLRRAETLLPNDVEVLVARADQLNRTGRVPESLTVMDRAAALEPTSPEFWDAYGVILEHSSDRRDEALARYSTGIEFAKAQGDMTWHNSLLLHRSRLLRKLNRPAEAGRDWCEANEIPVRDPRSNPQELDLASFFNVSLASGYGAGNDLAFLPAGFNVLAGVEFDVRGVVSLRGQRIDPQHEDFPSKVEGIPVTNFCRRVHFLHSAQLNVEEGTRIGAYSFRMASGRVLEWPLVWGDNVHSFLWTPWRPRTLGTNCVVAWTGSNAVTRRKDAALWLYKTTWENPQPDDRIESIDFVSDLTPCAPLLVAITVE